MRRFRETILFPRWDRELSEEGVWIFSDGNKQVTRGCYPKAIMSNALFTLLNRFVWIALSSLMSRLRVEKEAKQQNSVFSSSSSASASFSFVFCFVSFDQREFI
ncbi:hypothetical protein QOT17_011677 [Balamuthia mandrillaris]